jgi:hypothetical protein
LVQPLTQVSTMAPGGGLVESVVLVPVGVVPLPLQAGIMVTIIMAAMNTATSKVIFALLPLTFNHFIFPVLPPTYLEFPLA